MRCQDDYLQHYGVKGMKWGVRKKRIYSKDYSETKALRKKKASELSNEELRKLNERMNLEQNYERLNPSYAQRGIKTLSTISAVLGTIGAIYAASNSPWVKAGRKALGVG